MNAWSQLPNAELIDHVIESVKDNPKVWTAAWNAAWNAARKEAWDAALDAAWNAARKEAWDAALDAAWNAARKEAWDAALDAARNAARDAILALIAWDDSAEFLDMTSDELEVWARLSDDPRAILLLPAVRAFEKIAILETV